MNIEKSAAIIAKAYLRQVNSITYDLRCFEYTNKNEVMLKIQSLINVLDNSKLNETESFALQNQIHGLKLLYPLQIVPIL